MRFGWMIALLLLHGAIGCGGPRLHDTTMLTSVDVVEMTDQMVASLAASGLMEGRTEDSPPMVITMDRVANRTEHIMSPGERWGVINRLRALLMQTDLRSERHLIFVMPTQAWEALEVVDQAPPHRLKPTHALRATFRSDTQSSIRARTDAYLCAFQMLDLGDGALVWEDAFEVKYTVSRNRFD